MASLKGLIVRTEIAETDICFLRQYFEFEAVL